MPKLEHWSVIGYHPGSPGYDPPESAQQCLRGVREDGKLVITSPIVAKVGTAVQTWHGTLYTLGEVDRDYARLYRNAFARLLGSLPEWPENTEVVHEIA